MTTQSWVSRISRATSPYAVSLLSHSVPLPRPGMVTSAPAAAPMSAARQGFCIAESFGRLRSEVMREMKGDGDVVIEAARTLERMRDYLHAGVPHRQRAEIFARLSRLPLEELASMNPVQAEHAVESAARSLTDPQPGVQEGALVCEIGRASCRERV